MSLALRPSSLAALAAAVDALDLLGLDALGFVALVEAALLVEGQSCAVPGAPPPSAEVASHLVG